MGCTSSTAAGAEKPLAANEEAKEHEPKEAGTHTDSPQHRAAPPAAPNSQTTVQAIVQEAESLVGKDGKENIKKAGSVIQKSLQEEPWGEAGHRSMKGRNSLRRLADDGEVQAIDRMLADPEMSLDSPRVKDGNRVETFKIAQEEPVTSSQQQPLQLLHHHHHHHQQQQQQQQQEAGAAVSDPWSALQNQYRPQQLARESPLYEGSPKHALQLAPPGNKPSGLALPPLKGNVDFGRGLKGLPSPPKPAKWEGEDGEVMMIEEVGGRLHKGRSKTGADNGLSARSQQSSGQSQRSASLSGRRGQPAAPAALPGPPKAAGWGNGELAQPGTLMMDNDEDLDELEVYLEAPHPHTGPGSGKHDFNGADALPEGVIPSVFKTDENMGIEDLEEIDELFAQEQEATDKSDNLAAKYAKFEALANDD